MYQQLQKICREEVSRVDVFRANLGKFNKESFAPQKLSAPTLVPQKIKKRARTEYVISMCMHRMVKD